MIISKYSFLLLLRINLGPKDRFHPIFCHDALSNLYRVSYALKRVAKTIAFGYIFKRRIFFRHHRCASLSFSITLDK